MHSVFRLASFRVEVTPPAGHSLCAGWYGVAAGVADPLFASGVILCDGSTAPIVLCAVDWCEISNRSYLAWKTALATAIGTTPDRVSVHCMHPHCAPWPDQYAQQLMDAQAGVLPIMDAAWCEQTLSRVAETARAAMENFQAVTHLGLGKSKVEKIASNRRIMGNDGKIKAVRWTKTYDAAIRDEPEGLIDPFLKTISFWNRENKLAVLHYYATHPTSYEDAFITPDFTGLARERRQAEDNDVPHLYFTECAGNITAGKYNDGATENRELFTSRIHRAMVESEQTAQRFALQNFAWRTTEIILPPRADMNVDDLMSTLRDGSQSDKDRARAAIMLAYLERQKMPIEIAALHFGKDASLLHLPGEAFIEYQLFAQAQRPQSLVVAPAYGDCGPGYICLEKSFAEGGYEPTDAFVAGKSEWILKAAIAKVMAA